MKAFHHIHQLIALIIMLLLSQSIFAQQNMISGKITDENEQAVAFATTILLNASNEDLVKAVISDEDGNYRFLGIAAGDYKLKISSIGFEEYRSGSITVSANNLELDTIVLTTATESLEEVQVIAEKTYC